MSRLIADIGQLKPDIRLGQAVSEFGAALEGDQKSQFSKLRLSNVAPKDADIIQLCENINDIIKKRHRSRQSYGTWMQHALASIQALAAAGDVVIGGSQNLIACGVWAAVRTSLLFSVTHLSLFEKIAEMLMRVGRTAAIHRHLVGLFRREPSLRDMVCEYLIVIVELCQSFVTFRSKAVLARFVATFDMDKQLQGLEDRLNQWASLINEQVQLLQSQLAVEMSGKMTLAQKSHKFFRTSHSQERDRWHCLELMKYLSPHQEESERAWRRQRRKGTVQWVFDTPEFQSWAPPQNRTGSSPLITKHFLFITGGLGMGKTVVMANIVSRIMQNDRAVVLYYFIERSILNDLDADVVLRSLAHQFIRSVLDTSARNNVELPSIFTASQTSMEERDLRELINTAISHGSKLGLGPFYVVLDGFDHLNYDDARDIISMLKKCAIFDMKLGELRICLSLRSGSALKSVLSDDFHSPGSVTLAISPEKNSPELKDYIEKELADRPDFQELSRSTQAQIQQSVWSLADGMYLWASLQMDHLFPRYSRKVLSEQDIIGLLEHLPRPLSDLFDAALMSIIESKDQPTIFQLIIAAKRPLSLSELLVAVSVAPGSLDWNEEHISPCYDAAAKVYECSGGLLELDGEDHTVHFVHTSAYFHLTNPTRDWKGLLGNSPSLADIAATWKTSAQASDLTMGRVCLRYLDLPMHERQVAKVSAWASINHTQTVSHIQRSLSEQSSVIRYAERILRHLPSANAAVSVDLAQVAEGYLEDQKKLRFNLDRGGSKIQPTAFLKYASSYWLEHSDHFLFDIEDETKDDTMYAPFLKTLLNNCAANIELPFSIDVITNLSLVNQQRSSDKKTIILAFEDGLRSVEKAMTWAFEHKHLRLFWTLLDILDLAIDTTEIEIYLDGVSEMIKSLFPCKSHERDSRHCHGFPVSWETGSSLSANVQLPFTRRCRLHSRDYEPETLEIDAEAVLHVCVLGKCFGGQGVRYLVRTHMWKVFRSPLVADVPQLKRIMGRIGSFYTVIVADNAIKMTDAASLRQRKFSEWVSQESNRGFRTSARHNPLLFMEGLETMRNSFAYEYFLPILLRSWEEGYFTSLSVTSVWVARDLVHMLIRARAPCHLRDPQGLTPLCLALYKFADTWDDSDVPHFWSECQDCAWKDHGSGAAGIAARLCLSSLVSHKRLHASSEDIFGSATRILLLDYSQMETEEAQVELDRRQRLIQGMMSGKCDFATELDGQGSKIRYLLRVE